MKLSAKQVEPFTRRIRALDLNGWGGACGAAAIRINKEVFGGKGRLVGGLNEFLLERGDNVGHAAVLYGGRYWDSDGEIAEEDLLGWGMVDAEEYKFPAGAEELADEAILVEFDSEREVRKVFPWTGPIPSRSGSWHPPTRGRR